MAAEGRNTGTTTPTASGVSDVFGDGDDGMKTSLLGNNSGSGGGSGGSSKPKKTVYGAVMSESTSDGSVALAMGGLYQQGGNRNSKDQDHQTEIIHLDDPEQGGLDGMMDVDEDGQLDNDDDAALASASLNKTFTITFTFKEVGLSVIENGKAKTILHNISGRILPGRLTAVMGPSGCGKTSFLSTLSGKTYYGERRGEILINGQNVPTSFYKTITGFVPQEDTMHRSLLVCEVLYYQACLRCPADWGKAKLRARLEDTLTLLGLQHIRKSKIGDEEARGISGGQRKRVNIGMEIVSDPTLLFLDEPTSGLDSSSSLEVMSSLRDLAARGMTIMAVIHQPRYEIFERFHDVLFLGKGGQTVYLGPTDGVVGYFTEQERLGYTLPKHMNPADFVMDIISASSTVPCRFADRKPEDLFKLWNESPAKTAILAETERVLRTPSGMPQQFGHYQPRCMPGAIWQMWIFLLRCCTLLNRIFSTVLMDAALVIVGAIFLGAIYIDVPLAKVAGMQTLSSLVIGLTTMLSSLRVFGTDRPVFWREAATGVNRLAYFLAANLAQLPILVLTPLIYLSVLYTLLTPRSTFADHYSIVFLTVFATSGMGYFISCVLNPKNSQMAAVVFVLISSMLSGSSPTLNKLEDLGFLGRLASGLSFCRWMVEAMFNIECATYPEVLQPTVTGLQTMFGYELGRSKFITCAMVLMCMGLIARIAAFLALVLVNKQKQI